MNDSSRYMYKMQAITIHLATMLYATWAVWYAVLLEDMSREGTFLRRLVGAWLAPFVAAILPMISVLTPGCPFKRKYTVFDGSATLRAVFDAQIQWVAMYHLVATLWCCAYMSENAYGEVAGVFHVAMAVKLLHR